MELRKFKLRAPDARKVYKKKLNQELRTARKTKRK